MPSKRGIFTYSALFIVALALRLVYLLHAPAAPAVFMDSRITLDAARALLHGDWNGFLGMSEVEGPGYGLFDAALLLVTGSVFSIRLGQAVLGALTCVIIAVWGDVSGSPLGRRAGLLGGAIFAVLPTQILYVSYLTSEVVGAAIAAIGVALALGNPSIKRVVGSGIAMGVATLTRMFIAYGAVLVTASAILTQRRGSLARRAMGALAGTLIAIGLIYGWRDIVVVTGGLPFSGIEQRIGVLVTSADAAHPGWEDDRLSSQPIPAFASRSWTFTRDGNMPGPSVAETRRWQVSGDVAQVLQGHTVTIAFSGHFGGSDATAPPSFRYVVPYQWDSPWRQFENGSRFDLDIPITHFGNKQYIEVKGGGGADDYAITATIPGHFSRPLSALGAASRILTNTFLNFWFADDFGNLSGSPQIPESLIQLAQRVTVVAAMTGAAVAFTEFSLWAPVLAFALSGVLGCMAWVEQRHNMSFMPAVCLLAGLGLAWMQRVLSAACARDGSLSPAAALLARLGVATWALGLLILSLAGFSVPVFSQSPLGDLAVPLTVLGAVACVATTVSRAGERAAMLAVMAAGATLYGSYLWTSPTPRWHHHYIEMSPAETLWQRFRLAGTIDPQHFKAAAVVLDLAGLNRDKDALSVSIDGVAIANGVGQATSRYPNPPTAAPGSFRTAWNAYPKLYRRPLDDWPQWWAIPFDPRLLAGADVTVTLASAAHVKIGVVRGIGSAAACSSDRASPVIRSIAGEPPPIGASGNPCPCKTWPSKAASRRTPASFDRPRPSGSACCLRMPRGTSRSTELPSGRLRGAAPARRSRGRSFPCRCR
jgi:hypothetical protein